MPSEWEMFRQKQIPFGNEHCMQRRRVRAVALPLGAGGIAEDDGTGNSRFPSGMTTRKALHAADARFARHAAGVALPLVAGGIG